MRIRTRFILTMIIFSALLVFASIAEIVVSRMAAAAERDEQIADDIIRDIGDLYYTANSFLIYREPVQQERWRKDLARLSRDIEAVGTNQPDLNAIIRSIYKSRQRLEDA